MNVIELHLAGAGIAVETTAGQATETIDATPAPWQPLAALGGIRRRLVSALSRLRQALPRWKSSRPTQTAGSYRLLRKLGQGGMGEVHLGQHALLERPAAIKRLRSDKPRSAKARERFEWEVRAASGLTHPNTIAIYDFGPTPDGGFYYAMEYLEGLDLQRLVEQHGPLAPERVVFVVDQILGSLAEAHRRGILHRDVKPSNLFLTERGGEFDFVKVLDFGLAQEIHAPAPGSSDSTAPAGLVGTPLYMAPEVFYGDQPVDNRSDLYSLGAVAYFLLAGRPMFEKRSTVQVLIDQAKTSPATLDELGVTVSAELQAVLTRVLAKSTEERFRSAEDLRDALRSTPEWGRWTQEQAKQWWTLRAPDLRASSERPITRSLDSDSSLRVAA